MQNQYPAAVATSPLILPSDLGLVAFTFDPLVASGTGAPLTGVAGTLWGQTVKVPAGTLTNLKFMVTGAATTATAGQNFAGIYNSAGNLIASTADLSAIFNGAAGLATVPFITPVAVAAGNYDICFFWNATSPPQLLRGVGINIGQIPFNLRLFSANTGLTTALPATLGAKSAAGSGSAWWFGLS